MFPYSPNFSCTGSTGMYYEPAAFPHDQPFLIQGRPFLNDLATNPNCNFASAVSSFKQDQDLLENTHHHMHPPLSFSYYPSPLEEDDFLLRHQFSLHENTLSSSHHHHHQTGTPLTAMEWDSNKDDQLLIMSNEGEQQQQEQQQQQQIPMGRRSCKKDRHSKIRTARGLRDRRMRLSQDVATQFFGLQDMLGVDKGSKTIEWLLTKAGDEIRKLAREIYGQNENQSSISECEVLSGTDEAATDDIVDKISQTPSSSSCAKNRIKRTVRQPKKNAFFNPLAKASRVKARVRAKERTREKMERRQPKPCDDVDQATKMKLDLSRLSSWSTYQTGEESGRTQSHNNLNNHSLFEVLAEVEEPISCFLAAGTTIGVHQDLIEIDGHDAGDNLVTMGKWSHSSNFSSLQNTSASILQEQPHPSILWKTREVYNGSTQNGF